MFAVSLFHGSRQLMCARRVVCFAYRVLPIVCFFPQNCWGEATLTKLETEMRICRTKFDIVTLLFIELVNTPKFVAGLENTFKLAVPKE